MRTRSIVLFAGAWLGAGLVLGWAGAELFRDGDRDRGRGNREMVRRLVEELDLTRAQERDLTTVMAVIARQIDKVRSVPDHLKPEARKKIRETEARLDYIIQNRILTPDQLRRYMTLVKGTGIADPID